MGVHQKEGQFSWVRYTHQRINRNKNALYSISGPTGCQPINSKVLMANGEWKHIQDIKIGDEILSPQMNRSNKYSKVINTTKWLSNENYSINQLSRGKEKLYSCSYNHLIPVYHRTIPRINGKRKPSTAYWKTINYRADKLYKMSSKMRLHNNIGFSSLIIDKFKDRTNCEIEPYTLGVVLGDGMFIYHTTTKINTDYSKMKRKDKKFFHIRTYGRLSITSSKIDYEIMEEVSKHYPLMNILQKKGTNTLSYEFSINSELSNLLQKYGLTNKKSGTKFIPKEALLSDSNYRKRLLAGLIDTDGYYAKGKGGYQLTTKSKQLAIDTLFLVKTLGGRGSIKKIRKKIKKLNFEGTYYNLSFYLNDLELPLRLKRKVKDVSSIYLSSNRIGIDIKKAKSSMVYGFELDSSSGLYITDNFMVTHNSGKSWTGLSIGLLCDPEFNGDRCIFSARELMDLINSGKLSPGSAVLFDEAGIEMNSRTWNSITNKVLNYLIQTFRHRNFILIFTSPYLDFIDSATRKLFHAEFETIHINEKAKTCMLKPKLLQYNSERKKFYRKYLRVMVKGKGYIPIMKWKVPKPPQELIDRYEERKKEFTTKLNERIMADLERAQQKKRTKYIHTCKVCNYMWEGYVEQPKECRKCRKIQVYEVNPLEKQDLRENLGSSPIKKPI